MEIDETSSQYTVKFIIIRETGFWILKYTKFLYAQSINNYKNIKYIHEAELLQITTTVAKCDVINGSRFILCIVVRD